MKHTKLLVLALLVALFACLALSAQAENWQLVEEKAPDCLTQGWKLWVDQDSTSGASKIDYIAPLGHDWGAYQQVKAATCGAAGVQQQVCNRCGHYNAENILNAPPATGEHPKPYVVIKEALPATCTTDGWKALTKCSVCGKVISDGSATKATGHNVKGKDWEVYSPATCAKEGVIVQRCWDCNAIVNKQNTPKTSNHDWGTELPAKPATCTETGCVELQRCKTCGIVNSFMDSTGHYHDGRSVPALNHKWKIEGTVAPSCTSTGYTASICERCGHRNKIDIPATGQSAVWAPSEAAADGTYVVWTLKCNLCGLQLANQVVYKGQKAPSGTVNTATAVDTGKAAVDVSYTAKKSGLTEVAKTTTKKTTAKKTTTAKAATASKPATTSVVVAAAEVEGTKLVEGLNLVDGKAVVVAKEGKATLVYVEDGYTVKLADAELKLGEAVAYTADDLAVAEEAPVATASK